MFPYKEIRLKSLLKLLDPRRHIRLHSAELRSGSRDATQLSDRLEYLESDEV